MDESVHGWQCNNHHDVETQATVGVVVHLNNNHDNDTNNNNQSSATGQEEAFAAIGSVEWIYVVIDEDDSNDDESNDDSNSDSSRSSRRSQWQMIPAENLIAAAQDTGTKIAFRVSQPSNVLGLSNALELGVDALCIQEVEEEENDATGKGKGGGKEDEHDHSTSTTTSILWKTVYQARTERRNTLNTNNNNNSNKDDSTTASSDDSHTPQIITGSCWRRDTTASTSTTSTSIIADRICLDFVQTLQEEEGCWLGSSAKMMALVLSENSISSYVPTRPFRINAGPVHSYVVMGDGRTTKYLSEVSAGDAISIYNTHTQTSRPVVVGRIKEERRPCLIIDLSSQSQESPPPSPQESQSQSQQPQEETMTTTGRSRGQLFVQQAETVRFGQPEGKSIRVTELPPVPRTRKQQPQGTNYKNDHTAPLLLRITSAGTHIGKSYSGKVQER